MKKRDLLLILLCLLSGCTYIGPGIYHRVEKGETLWALSRTYDVDADKIIEANKDIGEPGNIKVGEQVYIPGASRTRRAVEKSEKLDFVWPVKGKIIQKFGKEGNKRHLGIGIKSMEGTPVAAAESGKVIFVSDNFRSYGKVVIIEHENQYSTVYAHNSKNTVEEEEQVEKGEKIAEVGSSGWAGTPNLYFEIRYKEKPRNPVFMLP